MKASDELFILIKSMSGKEKLFFRKKYLLLTEDKDGNYKKLFDEISRQAIEEHQYDEKKIKDGNYSGKFIKNLSFHKNYLYNLILNSLSFYNRENKDVYSIRNMMTQAEILSDKLLYDQSNKLLQRAGKYSEEIELFNNHFEILNIKKLNLKKTVSVDDYSAAIKDIFDKQSEITGLLNNLLDYYSLNENVGMFLKNQGSGKVRNKEKLALFEKIFENPLLKNIENAKSFWAKYIFYNLNLQYHLTKENYEQAYIFAESAVKLMEDNPDKTKVRLENYTFAVNNLLNCAIRTRRFTEFDRSAAKLYDIPNKYSDTVTEFIKVFIFYSLSVLKISKNMEIQDMEKLKETETEIKNSLSLYENKIVLYQRIILYYFLSTSNFIQNNFENCIYWNSKIINIGNTDHSEDYQCYARIIQLISYFEMGYIDSLEYALKSAYHFFSKKNKIYKYEIIIQKYLRKSFRIKTDNELKLMFRELKDEIEPLLNISVQINFIFENLFIF